MQPRDRAGADWSYHNRFPAGHRSRFKLGTVFSQLGQNSPDYDEARLLRNRIIPARFTTGRGYCLGDISPAYYMEHFLLLYPLSVQEHLFSTDMDFRKTAWSQWIDICADCYWLRMLCEQNPYLDLCCVGCMFRCSRFCFCIDRSALNVFILQRKPGTCALWKWNNRKNEECPPGWWAFLFCFENAAYSRIFVSRG